MPTDTPTLDEDARLRIIKAINMCETRKQHLCTSVIDQVLSPFTSDDNYICPTFTPSENQKLTPFYKKEVDKLPSKFKNRSIKHLVLPLCDGSHFNGYIVDFKKNRIVHVDSLFRRQSGRRSVSHYLQETFFPHEKDVEIVSIYPKPIQSDKHSCGAWLVMGMVAYLLGLETEAPSFTQEMAFSLLMLLVEDFTNDHKINKVREIFITPEKNDNANEDNSIKTKRTIQLSDDENYDNFVRSMSLRRMKKTILDDTDDNSDNDYLSDAFNASIGMINSTSISSSRSQSSSRSSSRSSFRSRSRSRSLSRSRSPLAVSDLNLSFTDDTHKVERFDAIRYEKIGNNNCGDDFIAQTNSDARIDFLSANDTIDLLRNPGTIIPKIPPGKKENVNFIVCNRNNVLRRNKGEKCIFFDDCGVWDTHKGKTLKSHYFYEENDVNPVLRHVFVRNGLYTKTKTINKKKVHEAVQPQPSNVIVCHRYYSVLKRCPTYRRRISWIENDKNPTALVEYLGPYPDEVSAHGNANHHTDDDYRRTNPETIRAIADLSKYQTPREIYKAMSKEDSFNGPKDFKQCQNVAHSVRNKEKKTTTGKKSNFADELLESLELVDTSPFVQQIYKSKGRLPNFILHTEDQIDDLRYFISHQGNLVLGIDRTFNLGSFFVTAIVYKNQRVVRSNNPDEHPLFLGPIYLHRDATFEAYHTFFSSVKATLCQKYNIQAIEISVGKKLVFGSDEEQALTKSIESVFPSSLRTLCTKHLKENVVNYMKNDAGVPQKVRQRIADKIFGDDGLSSADDSAVFDKRSSAALKEAKQFPIFVSYFNKKLSPVLKNYVMNPVILHNIARNWTNNNCESLNHIMKLDARWKTGNTSRMIELLHEMVMLHFRDFRRALYGNGNYRLVSKQKKRFGISKDNWRKLGEDSRAEKFRKFLKNEYKRKSDIVKSTYSNFTVTKPTTARKPGQKKRIRRLRYQH